MLSLYPMLVGFGKVSSCMSSPFLFGSHSWSAIFWSSWRRSPRPGPEEWGWTRSPRWSGRSDQPVGCTTYSHTVVPFCWSTRCAYNDSVNPTVQLTTSLQTCSGKWWRNPTLVSYFNHQLYTVKRFYFQQIKIYGTSLMCVLAEWLSFPDWDFELVDFPGHKPASLTSGCTLTQTHPAACFFSLAQSSRSVKRKTWRSFLEPSTSSTMKRSLSSWRFCQQETWINVITLIVDDFHMSWTLFFMSSTKLLTNETASESHYIFNHYFSATTVNSCNFWKYSDRCTMMFRIKWL